MKDAERVYVALIHKETDDTYYIGWAWTDSERGYRFETPPPPPPHPLSEYKFGRIPENGPHAFHRAGVKTQ